MNLEYSLASIEEIVINLLKNTLSKKGAKGVRNLIDDIMNERPLKVADDIKQELQKYSTDTLRLIVEKEILLSLENSSLANRKSYWDVLKNRAPRVKIGIMSHYYDNYINTLKQENPATYKARTITELNETYDKAINESFHVINEAGNAILDIVSTVNVNTNDNAITVNNNEAGNLVIDDNTKINDGKFVNKDEFITVLDKVDNLPNGSKLITNNPKISISDIKNITNSLSNNLNITSNENERTVTLGQAGIKEVGNINDAPTLPDGTYVSIEELNIAINNFINKPLEEKKPAKILRIKQEIRKQVAMVAMSFTILSAALPMLKNKIQKDIIPTITQEIDNGNLSTENIMSTINEQVSNITAGAQVAQNAVSGVVTKASEIGGEAVNALAQVPEIFQSQFTVADQVVPEVVAPVNEIVPEVTENVEVVNDVVPEITADALVKEPLIEDKEITEVDIPEETKEEVSEVTEVIPDENVFEDKIEETKIATKDDFSFRYPESNEIAAAARNMGFTDDEILIAVAISREETGNYTSPAFLEKNNFGGMTISNHERMRFETKEEGLNRFLLMLRNGYFDKGLTTINSMAPVYNPESNTWSDQVRGCMEKDGINPPQEEVSEPIMEGIKEVAESVEQPVNEIEEINQEKRDVIQSNNVEVIVDKPIEAETTEEISDSVGVVVEEPIMEETPVIVEQPITDEESAVNETPVIIQQPNNSEVALAKQEQIAVGQNIATTQNSSDTAAALLGITPEELDVVKATIRHEAGNNPAEIANVASCVRNRMISRAADPYSVITAAGQFESYLKGYYRKYAGGNYYQGDPETAVQVNAMLDGILTGTVPTTHGYENFRSASSPNGVQLTDGGNKYR